MASASLPYNDGLDNFPPGFRFCPTDVELIHYYLARKNTSGFLPPHRMLDVNIYKFTPEELFAMQPNYGGDERYFFVKREPRYPKGIRPSRSVKDRRNRKATGSKELVCKSGTWKATGAKEHVNNHGKTIGDKAKLKYNKSNWLMHEYMLPNSRGGSSPMKSEGYVLCKIYKKKTSAKNTDEDEADGDLFQREHNECEQNQNDFSNGTDVIAHENKDYDQNQVVAEPLLLTQCPFPVEEEKECFQGIEVIPMDDVVVARQDEAITEAENHPFKVESRHEEAITQTRQDEAITQAKCHPFEVESRHDEAITLTGYQPSQIWNGKDILGMPLDISDINFSEGDEPELEQFLNGLGSNDIVPLSDLGAYDFDFEQCSWSSDNALTEECSSDVSMMEGINM